MTLPELAVRPGWSRPDDLPQGDCVVTRLDDGRLRVDHADPRVLISAELLDAIIDGTGDDASPHVRVDLTGCVTYDGATMKIAAVNRTVIYRIVTYVPSVHGYIAEWPD